MVMCTGNLPLTGAWVRVSFMMDNKQLLVMFEHSEIAVKRRHHATAKKLWHYRKSSPPANLCLGLGYG